MESVEGDDNESSFYPVLSLCRADQCDLEDTVCPYLVPLQHHVFDSVRRLVRADSRDEASADDDGSASQRDDTLTARFDDESIGFEEGSTLSSVPTNLESKIVVATPKRKLVSAGTNDDRDLSTVLKDWDHEAGEGVTSPTAGRSKSNDNESEQVEDEEDQSLEEEKKKGCLAWLLSLLRS